MHCAEVRLARVQIFVRVRPLSDNETLRGEGSCVQIHSDCQISLNPHSDTSQYRVDKVFGGATTQDQLFVGTLPLHLASHASILYSLPAWGGTAVSVYDDRWLLPKQDQHRKPGDYESYCVFCVWPNRACARMTRGLCCSLGKRSSQTLSRRVQRLHLYLWPDRLWKDPHYARCSLLLRTAGCLLGPLSPNLRPPSFADAASYCSCSSRWGCRGGPGT